MDTLVLLLLLLLACFSATLPTESQTQTSKDLATCLSSSGVVNFTIPSSNPSDAATFFFYNILNFSIQNLRFAATTLPKPTAIVLPATQLDLQSTVLCCRHASLSIRIRSGGHSYEGLSYLADHRTPFVVIDMMNLNHVQVDLDSRTAWVESGATLGETYYAIAEHSKSFGFSAGSCPTVGSGGHIAGGGFGLLSRKYGLAADNVVDAILIDPEGRVLDRESMGEDVFWAIRGGGGGSWGAVYAWRIKLLPVPETVTGFVLSRPGSTRHVAGLVHKWQRVAPALPDDFYLSVFVGAGLPEATRPGMSASLKGFYLGPKSEATTILNQIFPELGLVESDCHEMSWIESVLFFSGLDASAKLSDLTDRFLHQKNYFKAKSDYVRAPISKQNLWLSFSLLAKEPLAYLILDPYGGAMSRIGSGDLPFPHRSGNLYAIQYRMEWTDADKQRKSEELYIQWAREFYDFMSPFVSKGPRAAYVNYLDLDLGTIGLRNGFRDVVDDASVWGKMYFLDNYERLVSAKTAIDPENVFNHPQSIPPLTLARRLGSNDSAHSVV